MQIMYTEGPDCVDIGQAGPFARGVVKEVEEVLAERLLKKKSINFQLVEVKAGDKKKKEA